MIVLWRILGLLMCAGVLLAGDVALAQGKRHALLIGVNAYQAVTPLQKAVGDAEALANILTSFGFEVMLVRDPTRRQMNEAISTFVAKLKPEDTAIVHFSGTVLRSRSRIFYCPSTCRCRRSARRAPVATSSVRRRSASAI